LTDGLVTCAFDLELRILPSWLVVIQVENIFTDLMIHIVSLLGESFRISLTFERPEMPIHARIIVVNTPMRGAGGAIFLRINSSTGHSIFPFLMSPAMAMRADSALPSFLTRARSWRPPIGGDAAVESLFNDSIDACALFCGEAVQTRTPQKIGDEPGGPSVGPILARDRR
jgi:hypothetical protein